MATNIFMFIRTCHQSSWLQLDRKFTLRAVNRAQYCAPYRSPALRLLFVGTDGRSVASGLVRRAALLDMYPIRGYKDSKKLPTHRVVWLVPLQHLRQLRTLRTARIIHIVRLLNSLANASATAGSAKHQRMTSPLASCRPCPCCGLMPRRV